MAEESKQTKTSDKSKKLKPIFHWAIILVALCAWAYTLFNGNMFISGDINDSVSNLIYSSLFLYAFLVSLFILKFKKEKKAYYIMFVLIVFVMFVVQFISIVGFFLYMKTQINFVYALSFAGLSLVIGFVIDLLIFGYVIFFRPKNLLFMVGDAKPKHKW